VIRFVTSTTKQIDERGIGETRAFLEKRSTHCTLAFVSEAFLSFGVV
jgi:hypothetical protein